MDNYRHSITKEEIEGLPLADFNGEIVIIDSPGRKLNNAVRYLSGQKIIGFDTETKPNFVPGERRNHVALLQLSGRDRVYLFRTCSMGLDEKVASLLSDENILKVGAAVKDDINGLCRLRNFIPGAFVDLQSMEEDIELSTARLISIVRTMAAMAYKKSIGEPVVYPRHDLTYCANFLNMMFDSPVNPYKISPEAVRILNILLILHADHEQNCSTTTVRTIGSAQVNLYATISAGISALSGPLHGGANQEVVEMLRMIERGGSIERFLEKVKDKNNPTRLMGFGHRVYKTFDPRAKIIKKECHDFLQKMNISDPLLDVALELEERALKDDYFISRNLYPNVDFYSGIVYRALGIPENMFTVMFALARLPGWIAHWKEMIGMNTKIVRPRQIYTGKNCTRIRTLKH